METFWVTFIAAIVGGLIASALSARLDRAFRPPIARDAAAFERYPHSVLVRTAAYLVLTAWLCIFILFPVTFVWALVSRERYVPVYMLVVLGALIVVMPMYLVLALLLRCKHCGRRLLVQTVSKPPHGQPSRNMSAWGRLIILIALHGRFRCMYCGQTYAVHEPAIETD